MQFVALYIFRIKSQIYNFIKVNSTSQNYLKNVIWLSEVYLRETMLSAYNSKSIDRSIFSQGKIDNKLQSKNVSWKGHLVWFGDNLCTNIFIFDRSIKEILFAIWYVKWWSKPKETLQRISLTNPREQMRKNIEKKELSSRNFALSRDGGDTGFYRILNDGFVPTRCLVPIMLSGLYNIVLCNDTWYTSNRYRGRIPHCSNERGE